MQEDLCTGMRGLCRLDFLFGNRIMDRAAAFPQNDIFFRQAGLDISAQVFVRDEKDVLFRQGGDDFQRAGGGHTDITFGL